MIEKRTVGDGWTKVLRNSDWGFPSALSTLVKRSSTGLAGADRKALAKAAGTSFADRARRLELAPGEVPVHILGLGSTELWGPNENGDGFKAATCRDRAHTFESGWFYRDHVNHDPARSYGKLKLACFNEPMGRVEILAVLNGTKEAAARNGGLVADRELDLLERGRDFATSMSCRIPYDVCSACGNKAASRADYCTAATCPAGGCRTKLGKVVRLPGGRIHHLHVDNPNCTWFEMSHVGTPADRTSFAVDARPLFGKAASLRSAPLFEPAETAAIAELRRHAALLAKRAAVAPGPWDAAAVPSGALPPLPPGVVPAQACAALAEKGAALPYDLWSALYGAPATPGSRKSARAGLAGLHLRPDLPTLAGLAFAPPSAAARAWAERVAPGFLLSTAKAAARVGAAALAAATPPAWPAAPAPHAVAYGAYLAAACPALGTSCNGSPHTLVCGLCA